MDSTSSDLAAPSILVVDDDAGVRTAIALALRQAGYEAVPASSGEDALDLIAAADFDGLYCTIELPGQVDGWEVGTTFSFIWPDKPAVYASAVQTILPGRLRHGIFLRKPFAMDRLVRVFEAGATAASAKRQLT
ncbi:response regulator [Microvirga lotononidis]|uniref:Response regulator with CheY-like receiver, AAA-type ATPase, and DNA-binding domains n=1 Tax=Microvirga lotononidis TaxID=864069 RepID=I4YPS4_9HYPH|nr:response regulator [Microvirga lotononidis]EIM25966.1 response regulator with CheY-like receiver, AAA-type ATPase, and DNA-binding domains [Microvirga lotononidis]WQO25879.1 response regulator [Microvirga lotononidis]